MGGNGAQHLEIPKPRVRIEVVKKYSVYNSWGLAHGHEDWIFLKGSYRALGEAEWDIRAQEGN